MIESQSPAICSANNCDQMIKNNEIYPDFAAENDLNILTNIICHNETKGYDKSLNTISTISNEFICSSCHHLVVEPKFSTCGHRYCSYCIEKMIESQSPAICSANNCDQMIKNNEIYPDFAAENDLNILTNIICHNETKGCSWKGWVWV
ncbi:unnamed protein product [Rotaria sordida]|nr:unnamed protein product [Rotaria sordida]CAF1451259.1 unnamed protein product [Rotaria sordida]